MTVRTKHERLEPLLFRVQLQDTRANAQGRIIGNKHRKGLGTSRADVCWNGRRPCEPEFNFRIRGKAVRNGPLDRSDVKNVKRSADDSGKWTPFLLFRVQLLRIRGKSFTVRRIWVWALLLVYSFIPVRQYFTLYQQYLLNIKKVNKPLCLTHCSYLLG